MSDKAREQVKDLQRLATRVNEIIDRRVFEYVNGYNKHPDNELIVQVCQMPLNTKLKQAECKISDLKAEVERFREAAENLLDFAKSFEKRSDDAWKPFQLFRSDSEVEIDEIKRELLEELNEEAKISVSYVEELLTPPTEDKNKDDETD